MRLRNYLGLGSFDFLLTKMVDTAYLQTSSDDWFADFEGIGFPQMAVGRLPARTASDAFSIVAKILAFRRRDPNASWTRRALLVTDQGDSYDFQAASAQVRACLPTNLSSGAIDRGQLGNATRQTFLGIGRIGCRLSGSSSQLAS